MTGTETLMKMYTPAPAPQYIDIFFFLRKIIQLYRKVQVHSHFGKTLHYLEINQSISLYQLKESNEEGNT